MGSVIIGEGERKKDSKNITNHEDNPGKEGKIFAHCERIIPYRTAFMVN